MPKFDYQPTVVKRIRNLMRTQPGHVLQADAGLGKTRMTLELFSETPAVGFVPTGLMGRWMEDAAAVGVIVLPIKDGKQLMDFARKRKNTFYRRRIILCSYAVLNGDESRKFLTEYVRDKVVFIDELGNFKTPTSQRTINIRSVVMKAKFRLGLTAQLVENNYIELYSQMSCCVPQLYSLNQFQREHVVFNSFGGIDGYKNVDTMKATILPYVTTIRDVEKDYTTQDKVVFVELDEKWSHEHNKRAGKLMQAIKDTFIENQDDMSDIDYELNKQIARADVNKRITWLKKMLSSPAKAGKCKANRLVTIVTKHGPEGGLVFCDYSVSARKLFAILTKRFKDLNIVSFTGATPPKHRQRIVDEFNAGKINIVVGTPAMSRGYNFHKGGFVVNYDIPWNPALFRQRNGRIQRIISKGTKRVFTLVIKGTTDEYIYGVTKDKEMLDDIIFGKGSHVRDVQARSKSWLKWLKERV